MAPPPRSSKWGSPEAPKPPCFPHALALVCAACLAARRPSRRALLRGAADGWMVLRAGLYSGFDATCLDMAHEHALYQQQVHTRTRTHARTRTHSHARTRTRTHALARACTHARTLYRTYVPAAARQVLGVTLQHEPDDLCLRCDGPASSL